MVGDSIDGDRGDDRQPEQQHFPKRDGWQMQAEGLSVQSVLEKAVAIINGAPAAVHGAGRTDAGVHALGQVAHVDLLREWDPFVLRNALNGNVRPHPVSVLEAKPVADDFHARFAARRRHYLYRILNRRAPPALDRVPGRSVAA